MKLAWLTDLHLDHVGLEGTRALASDVRAEGADRLLLTGDIATSRDLLEHLDALVEGSGAVIDFVLGNHDYYRSDLASVRARVLAHCSSRADLRWLGGGEVVALDAETALVGVDGWADARFGDFGRSSVRLTDHLLVGDLAETPDDDALERKLRELGEAEAAALAPALERALALRSRVIVATHPPPFREACWYDGRISSDDWLPHVGCGAVGEVLLEAARSRPEADLLVLCGHTHGAGECRPAPNLRVITGGATYGAPAVAEWFLLGENASS